MMDLVELGVVLSILFMAAIIDSSWMDRLCRWIYRRASVVNQSSNEIAQRRAASTITPIPHA